MPRLRLSELTWSRRGLDGGEMIKNRAVISKYWSKGNGYILDFYTPGALYQ